jgi:hypothetical protein
MVRTSQCFSTDFLQPEGPQKQAATVLLLGPVFGDIVLFAHGCNACRLNFSSTLKLRFSLFEFAGSGARTRKMVEEKCESTFRTHNQWKRLAAASVTVD